jgi:hypothetical protein
MTKEEMVALATKIKKGTASKEETLKFHEEYNALMSQINELLK